MTKVVVIIGFVVAFAAGLVVGVSRQPRVAITPTAPVPPPAATTQPPQRGDGRGGPQGELNRLLNLTPQQQQQLKEIWSEMAERGRRWHEENRRELRRQREEKVQALLSPQQRAQFEQIHQEYEEQTRALEREMRGNFQTAVERTKAVLDPEQRAKYEEWLSKRHWDRDRGGRDGGRGRDRDRDDDRERDRDRGGRPPRPDGDTNRGPDADATPTPSNQP